MAKQTNTARKPAPAALVALQPANAPAAKAAPQPATPAPAATQPAPVAWPAGWHSNGSAKAWPALVAAGAQLVRLPSMGVLHNALSALPAAVPAAQLPALLAHVQAGWPAFNVGYLCGGRASYAACAAVTCGKKAKQNPAYVWAVNGPAGVALYTQTGAVWQAPPPPMAGKVCRMHAAYTAALAAAVAAFAPPVQA